MTFNRDVQCMDMRLQYLSTSTVELLLMSYIITIIMLFSYTGIQYNVFHTLVNIHVISKDQRDI